jgi:RNA polymerase sigma factor (sigma-70 family)
VIGAEDILLMRETRDAIDRRLIHRCIEDDQQAWKELVIRYEELIFSVALQICGDAESSADILQQVCLELCQRLDEVRNVASLPSWITAVTQRKSLQYRKSRVSTEALYENCTVESQDVFASIERQHTLARALASLPARNRRLIEMMYMSGGRRSYEEIAEELGMPAASIGPTRIRSLKKLRKLLR